MCALEAITCSKVMIETLEQGMKYDQSQQWRPEQCQWYRYCHLWAYFTTCSSVSIVNFEAVNAGWVVYYNK